MYEVQLQLVNPLAVELRLLYLVSQFCWLYCPFKKKKIFFLFDENFVSFDTSNVRSLAVFNPCIQRRLLLALFLLLM